MHNVMNQPRARGLVGVVRADSGNPTALIAELNRTFAEFREKNDQRLEAIEARGAEDVLDREQVDRINTALTEQQQAVDALNERLASAILQAGDGSAIDPAVAAHATAFETFFRRGENRIDGDLNEMAARAALQTQSDPDGGYVVPEQTETTIERVLGTISAMRSLARVIPISHSVYKKLVNQGGTSSGWVGETDGRPQTDPSKLSVLAFEAMELYAQPAATQTLLDDGVINIEQWLADEVAIEFAEQEGAAFINGDGNKKPRGLLSYDTVQNDDYKWGKLGFVASGDAAGFAASDPADALINLVHSLKAGYRANASFLMNDLTTAAVRKFKNAEGEYIWQPSIQVGTPSQLLGYAHHSDDNMPDIAANALPIAFGDFKRGYLIVDRRGATVLRDPYTAKPYVLFYTTKRVGGGVQNFEAIKLMKMANG